MKAKNVLIAFAILIIAMTFPACGGPTGPDDPSEPPEEVELYTWIVTYVRPQGSIVRPEEADPERLTLCDKYLNIHHGVLTKISDYEFTAEIIRVPTHLKNEKDAPPNILTLNDHKRWVSVFDDGALLWGNPLTVGDIFKIKLALSGTEVTLTNIIPNTFVTGLPAGNSATVAQFWTLKGGIAVNEWPSQ